MLEIRFHVAGRLVKLNQILGKLLKVAKLTIDVATGGPNAESLITLIYVKFRKSRTLSYFSKSDILIQTFLVRTFYIGCHR